MSLKVKIKIDINDKSFETVANFSPSISHMTDIEDCVRNATAVFLNKIKEESGFSTSEE